MAHAQKPDFVFRAKRTSPFKSAGGRQFSRLLPSRGVRISGSNAGYTIFRGSVKSTGYLLHSPVSPSLPLPASPCAVTFQPDPITVESDRRANLRVSFSTTLGTGKNIWKLSIEARRNLWASATVPDIHSWYKRNSKQRIEEICAANLVEISCIACSRLTLTVPVGKRLLTNTLSTPHYINPHVDER